MLQKVYKSVLMIIILFIQLENIQRVGTLLAEFLLFEVEELKQ